MNVSRPLLASSLVFLALASSSPAARAQPGGNAAAAQLLFDDAKALVKKGDYAHACPKFVESHRLDPAGGTILHAADCHQSEGKLATAWTEYNEALSFAVRDKRSDREGIAREQIAALAPKLGKLTLSVAPESRAIEALALRIDGALIERAGWDTPIPVDQGSHRIEAAAPGYEAFQGTVDTTDGHETPFAVPALTRTPAAVAPAPAPDGGSRTRTLAFVAGGIGLAGLAVGGVFGIRAIAIGDQRDQCKEGPNQNGCTHQQVEDQDTARTSATISTVGFIVGAVGLAGGVVLWLTAPKSGARAGVALTPNGASFGGTF